MDRIESLPRWRNVEVRRGWGRGLSRLKERNKKKKRRERRGEEGKEKEKSSRTEQPLTRTSCATGRGAWPFEYSKTINHKMAGRNTREKYETGMSLLVSGPSAARHAPGEVNSIHTDRTCRSSLLSHILLSKNFVDSYILDLFHFCNEYLNLIHQSIDCNL